MTSDEKDLITIIKEILNHNESRTLLKKETLSYKNKEQEQKDLIKIILKILEEDFSPEYANSILEKAKKKLKK